MKNWVFTVSYLTVVMMRCSAAGQEECNDISMGTVSCDFEKGRCQWKNCCNSSVTWENHSGRSNSYNFANLSGIETGKATLISPVQCPTDDIYYSLTFRYRIDCPSGECQLSVLINKTDQSMVLWSGTMATTGWLSVTQDRLLSRDSNFQIVFEAENLGNMHSGVKGIGIDDIAYQNTGITATTPAPTTTTSVTTLFPNTISTTISETLTQTSTTLTTTTTDFAVSTEIDTTQKQTSAGDSDAEARKDKDNSVGIGIGVTVSVLVVVGVTVAVFIIIRRRQNNNDIMKSLPIPRPGSHSDESHVLGVENAASLQYENQSFPNATGSTTAYNLYDQLTPPEERNNSREYEVLGGANVTAGTIPIPDNLCERLDRSQSASDYTALNNVATAGSGRRATAERDYCNL